MKRDLQIAPKPSKGFLRPIDADDMPDALFGFVLQIEDFGVPASTLHISGKVRAMAKAQLSAMSRHLAPVSDDVVRDWIAPLLVACPNPKPADQIPAWFEAVKLAMADAPTGAFTVRSQAEALRTLTFFPSPADIWGIVSRTAGDLRRREATLKTIIGEERP